MGYPPELQDVYSGAYSLHMQEDLVAVRPRAALLLLLLALVRLVLRLAVAGGDC